MSGVRRYISRNRNGVLYFPAVVPRDLQPWFPVREIQRSLRRTVSVRCAAMSAALLWVRLSHLFMRMRQMPPDTRRKLNRTDLIMGRIDVTPDGTVSVHDVEINPENATAEVAVLQATIRALRGASSTQSQPSVDDSGATML